MRKAIDILIYVILFFAMQLISVYIANFLWNYFAQKPYTETNPQAYVIGLAAFALITAALFGKMKWCPLGGAYIRQRPWTTLLWVFMAAIGTIVPSVCLLELLGNSETSVMEQLAYEMVFQKGGFFVMCILVPLAEEMVYRGAILRTLLGFKVNPWIAILISAVIFGMSHLNVPQFIHGVLFAIFMGWMYCRTRSIVPCLLAHSVNNIIVCVSCILFRDPDVTLTKLFNGNTTHVVLAVVFSLCILVPSIVQLNLNMKRPSE